MPKFRPSPELNEWTLPENILPGQREPGPAHARPLPTFSCPTQPYESWPKTSKELARCRNGSHGWWTSFCEPYSARKSGRVAKQLPRTIRLKALALKIPPSNITPLLLAAISVQSMLICSPAFITH